MRRRKKLSRLIAWVSLVLLVSGCGDFPEVAQPYSAGMTVGTVGEIYGPHIVGQTFVAHHKGIYAIEVLLATYARENQGTIVFHLREGFDSTDIASVEVPAKAIKDNGFHRFSFPTLPDSAGKSYYFFLESPDSKPGDSITAWQGTANSYQEGTIYLDGDPQSGQLVFIIHYDLLSVARELVRAFLASLDTAILAILLVFLPGHILMLWLLSDRESDGIERFASAMGMSVAFYPLLFLVAHLMGIRLGRGLIVALFIAFCLLTALRIYGRRGEKKPTLLSARKPSLPAVIFAAVFVLSAAIRFVEVWGLSVPMWGDSYHHTMIAQLMVGNGGLFSSWEPYAPLASFTYHFGFHSLVATFHWLTGVGVVQSVIVVGQILNLLTVSGAYLLTTRLTKNRWAGVAAATLTGLVSHMPAFYFNWGRYTQLAGQVILPVAMVLSLETLEDEKRGYRSLAAAALALASLILTHYRVAIFCALFIAISILSATYRSRAAPRRVAEIWLRGMGVGLLAVFVTLPWLLNTQGGLLPQQLATLVGPASRSDYLVEIYNAWGDVEFTVGYPLIAIGLAGAILGIVMRQRNVVVIVAWIGSLLLLANPNRLGLPGVGIVNNFAILIAMYIPLSFLGGFIVGHIIEALRSKRPGMEYLAALAMLLFGLWGGRSLVSILDQRHTLVTKADEQAMEWIKGNTPSEARFVVNSVLPPVYGGTTVVGLDAGWWIPLLTGRQNTVPPITYAMERSSEPGYVQRVNAFNRRVLGSALGAEATVDFLRENGVTHVYVGRSGGPLRVEELLGSPYYHKLYARDGVWIFEVVD